MTEKLFYADPYMKEFQGVISEIRINDAGTQVILDKSAFYPEGGGQPCDTGTLTVGGQYVFEVIDVQEDDGVVLHTLKTKGSSENISDILKKGTEVKGVIDWERRFDHMQQHSGEHIISGMLCSAFNCDNVGFHMGEDVITIDYNAKISLEEALKIEQKANDYISQDHEFCQSWPTKEELKQLQYRSKKEIEGDIRITSFPGADICACCGTHVKSSAQVGFLKVVSAKNFHDGTRIELYCGKRAFEYLSKGERSARESAAMLSTKQEKVPEIVAKLMEENISLKSQAAALEERFFSLWADSFDGRKNVLVIEEDLLPEQGRRLADMIADKCTGMAVVMAAAGSGYRYSIVSRTEETADFVKELNAALDGKGGGRGGFAQGSVQAKKTQIIQFFEKYL